MSPEFPDLSPWEDLQADQLDSPEELPSDELVEAKSEAARKKADQTHRFRNRLFNTVSRSLVCTLAAAVLIMITYMISEWGELEPSVIISFNAAVVVNTVGLAYIVANYLFPKGGGD